MLRLRKSIVRRQRQPRAWLSTVRPIGRSNPAAELANEFTEEAAEIVEDLANKAHDLAESMNWRIS